MRWRTSDSEHVLDLDTWVSIYTDSVMNGVKQQIGPKDPAKVIRGVLADALREAYEAGQRYGKARAESNLVSAVQTHVERALKGVKIEAAHCPHCAGRGCSDCNDTGKFQR